jgi:hypothetical protein
VLLLLCICEALRDPSCIPCLESKSISMYLTMYARDPHICFLAGVDHELCDHTPPPFFIIVREPRGVLAKRMRCIFLWSVCPRGPLRLILSSASWNSGTSLLCAPDAPAPSVACPLDPGPSCVLCQGRSVGDADDALCTNRQYVDMNRSFAALSNFDLSVSHTTGPLVVSQDPPWLSLGGNGDGVLTGNERYVFPPAQPTLGALRGALGSGG